MKTNELIKLREQIAKQSRETDDKDDKESCYRMIESINNQLAMKTDATEKERI